MDTEYIGQLVAGLAYFVVGVGLMRLALRTKHRPERLLGVYFIGTGLDYLFYTIPYVFRLDALMVAGSAAARISYAIAVIALLIFTREVFRASQGWARWLTGLLTASLLFGVAGPLWQGQWEGPSLDGFFYWPYFLGYFAACVWVTAEACIAYTSARKRLAIGLCEPIVANRYMLWGAFGALQVLACGAVVLVDVLTLYEGGITRWSDFLLSGCEIGSVAMLWLAFFPPSFYRNWMANSNSAAESQEAN